MALVSSFSANCTGAAELDIIWTFADSFDFCNFDLGFDSLLHFCTGTSSPHNFAIYCFCRWAIHLIEPFYSFRRYFYTGLAIQYISIWTFSSLLLLFDWPPGLDFVYILFAITFSDLHQLRTGISDLCALSC